MENNIKKQLLNAEGKRLLEKTKLDYSKEILAILKNDPNILYDILENMYLSQDEVFSYLSGDVKGNMVVYDQMLVISRKKILEKNYKSK